MKSYGVRPRDLGRISVATGRQCPCCPPKHGRDDRAPKKRARRLGRQADDHDNYEKEGSHGP